MQPKKYIPIREKKNLVRDKSNGAIINTDIHSYNVLKKKREYRKNLENRVAQLEDRIAQLEGIINGSRS